MLDINRGPHRRVVRRQRRLRILRRLGIIGVVVVVFLGGIFFAYRWYKGIGNESTVSVRYISKSPATAMVTPSLPGAAKPKTAIKSISSPVNPGANATIIANTTTPDATCSLVVYDKAITTAPSQKTADKNGIVTWTWNIPSVAPTGAWPATVTCTSSGQTTKDVTTFVVKKTTS